jgi:DNA-binding transcriptional LysR family regulator
VELGGQQTLKSPGENATVEEVKVQKADRGELGSLIIGYTGPALYSVLPNIIRTFRDRYPQVELILKEISTDEQVEALNAEDIEVGFLHPPVDGDFEFLSIMSEKMVLALPENHPLTTLTQVPISKLSDQPFILFPRQVGPNLYKRYSTTGFIGANLLPHGRENLHDTHDAEFYH